MFKMHQRVLSIMEKGFWFGLNFLKMVSITLIPPFNSGIASKITKVFFFFMNPIQALKNIYSFEAVISNHFDVEKYRSIYFFFISLPLHRFITKQSGTSMQGRSF